MNSQALIYKRLALYLNSWTQTLYKKLQIKNSLHRHQIKNRDGLPQTTGHQIGYKRYIRSQNYKHGVTHFEIYCNGSLVSKILSRFYLNQKQHTNYEENVIKQPCDVLLDTYLYLQLKEPETIKKQQKIYDFILQFLVQKRKQETEQQYKVFNVDSVVQSINDQFQNPELENEISYDNFLTRFSDNWGEEFERGIDINTSEHTVIANIEISSFKVDQS
ncbi:Hypothetical_protein [Hexamita inflata]|uniref:Hypothetical_protein n=1 Tax=Hexamita inflata TaxID=28002 RepID=A0AA86UR58_9EUKA|nr:Hypothetical protein HINF_LOCUS35208 [Hexamita inflata]